MINPDGTFWSTDKDLFSALPGGRAVIDWFGYVPSFHDAELDGLKLARGAASIALRAFRMTNTVNAKGCFVLDKHAIMTLHLTDVTGVHFIGNAASIPSELGIRRVEDSLAGFSSCEGPTAGDLEVSFETSYGLEGSIYARKLSFSVDPVR